MMLVKDGGGEENNKHEKISFFIAFNFVCVEAHKKKNHLEQRLALYYQPLTTSTSRSHD